MTFTEEWYAIVQETEKKLANIGVEDFKIVESQGKFIKIPKKQKLKIKTDFLLVKYQEEKNEKMVELLNFSANYMELLKAKYGWQQVQLLMNFNKGKERYSFYVEKVTAPNNNMEKKKEKMEHFIKELGFGVEFEEVKLKSIFGGTDEKEALDDLIRNISKKWLASISLLEKEIGGAAVEIVRNAEIKINSSHK